MKSNSNKHNGVTEGTADLGNVSIVNVGEILDTQQKKLSGEILDTQPKKVSFPIDY